MQVDTIRSKVKRNRESLENLEPSTEAHSVDACRLFSQDKKKEQHLPIFLLEKIPISNTKPTRRYQLILLVIYLGRKQSK